MIYVEAQVLAVRPHIQLLLDTSGHSHPNPGISHGTNPRYRPKYTDKHRKRHARMPPRLPNPCICTIHTGQLGIHRAHPNVPSRFAKHQGWFRRQSPLERLSRLQSRTTG